MSLTDKMKQVRQLVKTKGFKYSWEDFPFKLLYGMIEFAEAADKWKKGMSPEEIAEELIDVIFYVLDAYHILMDKYDVPSPEEVFQMKLEKNMRRPRLYGKSKWSEDKG